MVSQEYLQIEIPTQDIHSKTISFGDEDILIPSNHLKEVNEKVLLGILKFDSSYTLLANEYFMCSFNLQIELSLTIGW